MEEKRVTIFLILAIIIVSGVISLVFTNTSLSPKKDINLEECKTLIYNGEEKVDLLFFAKEEEVKNYFNLFFDTEPFDKYMNSFNFYYIDSYSPECELYKGIALYCHSRNLVKKAGSCPSDYIIVLKSEKKEIRSSSYLNVLSLNRNHEFSVFLHEFGHAFAGFAEEYVPGNIPKKAKNCVPSCSKFDGKQEGCFEGCSKENYFRSVDNGIMRTLKSDRYGDFNEIILLDKLENNLGFKAKSITGSVIDFERSCSEEEYYLIELEKKGDEFIEIGKKLDTGCFEGNGYGDYEFDIFSNGLNIYSDLFDPENLFTDIPDEGGVLSGLTYDYEGLFYIKVPVLKGADKLKIKNFDGDLVSEIRLDDIDARACLI